MKNSKLIIEKQETSQFIEVTISQEVNGQGLEYAIGQVIQSASQYLTDGFKIDSRKTIIPLFTTMDSDYCPCIVLTKKKVR